MRVSSELNCGGFPPLGHEDSADLAIVKYEVLAVRIVRELTLRPRPQAGHPVVLKVGPDASPSGIVPRLNQPGGNITGFANNEASLPGKWLELLSEIAPGLKRVAIPFNPDTAFVSVYMPSLETAARSLKVEPITAPVHSDNVGSVPLFSANNINALD
jgi:ABC-type uncharacterized transport system substrate-binding protein